MSKQGLKDYKDINLSYILSSFGEGLAVEQVGNYLLPPNYRKKRFLSLLPSSTVSHLLCSEHVAPTTFTVQD
jgi:hypothetical protein